MSVQIKQCNDHPYWKISRYGHYHIWVQFGCTKKTAPTYPNLQDGSHDDENGNVAEANGVVEVDVAEPQVSGATDDDSEDVSVVTSFV
jgi:hypothetical protein